MEEAKDIYTFVIDVKIEAIFWLWIANVLFIWLVREQIIEALWELSQ